MTVSQKVQIDTYDYGSSLTAPTVRALSDDAQVGDAADSCNELTADSGIYLAEFVGANEAALIPGGTYRLRTSVGGLPLKWFVTFAGVDGEVVYARDERAVELDPAVIGRLWTEDEKAQIRYRLGLDGTATAPDEPDVDPIVITPATGIMTTGYLVTRLKGVPTAGITIRYQQAQEPAADRGSSYDDTIYSATSNSEGIAELSLVKGGLYYVWRSAASRPMNVAAYRVLKADGTTPDATLALPSHVGA